MTGNTFAQNKPFINNDSILSAYFQKCADNSASPDVLLQTDTLFEMATVQGDKWMQTQAYLIKLDHYYYMHNADATDSIIVWVDRTKELARKNEQPKPYYFAWAARLINHYIGLGKYNIALLETEKMMKEAEAEDYKEGVADCYACLSNIYSAKQLKGKALEFMLKEIELFQNNQIERYNISLQYSDAANAYIQQGNTEAAIPLLKNAVRFATTPYHRATADLVHVELYLAQDKIAEAAALLEKCRKTHEKEPALRRHIRYLYQTEISYYRKIKEYNRALEALERCKEELLRKNEAVTLVILNRTKADILWEMGNKEEAALQYREYLNMWDKEKEKNEEITTGEFATLLNIQKLTIEKNDLEKLSQERRLQTIRIIVFLLVGLLLISSVFLYYQRKLNRKLKRSEENLRSAKEIAEHSNKLKSVFIQNMSHEIRTPLNAIVGFSAVLTETLYQKENEEINQYSAIIEENSQILLKLINDILSISILDESDQEIEYAPTDINACCRACLEEVKPIVRESVELSFKSSCKELIIDSNEELVKEVLNNLLNNAAKFTYSGEIALAYTINEKARQVTFTITDTGIGIPVEQQENVFERFVKLSEFTQGTGLGLSISKMVAEKLGGSLFIDKKYRNGCRIVFSISFTNPN